MNQEGIINSNLDDSNVNQATPAVTAGEKKRKRRSKHESEGRVYKCECGKSYLSQPALNNHKNTKHILPSGASVEKRGRGRPRKYLAQPPDNELIKYENFFAAPIRRKVEGEILDMNVLVNSVYEDIYVKNSDKCFISPKQSTDHPILLMLINEQPLTSEKIDRKCDEVFYEYLRHVKDKTNKSYYILILKFIILFRECLNLIKYREVQANQGKSSVKEEYSRTGVAENLPELCNEFVADFMEVNNYFGIDSENDRNELIELIQHFCNWLFKNEYTKSKLTLSSPEAVM